MCWRPALPYPIKAIANQLGPVRGQLNSVAFTKMFVSKPVAPVGALSGEGCPDVRMQCLLASISGCLFLA